MKQNIGYVLLIIFFLSNANGQEILKPLTAEAFNTELNNSLYQAISNNIKLGNVVSPDDSIWVSIYNEYLKKYYSQLPEDEKNKINASDYELLFTRKELVVENEISLPVKAKEPGKKIVENTDVQNVFLKQLFYSGYYGMYYGLATNAILNLEDAMAAGLPFVVSGGNMLILMTMQNREKIMTNKTLWLRAHGKFVGAIQGFCSICVAIW